MTETPEINIDNALDGLTITKNGIFLVGTVGKYPEQEGRYKTGEGKNGIWHLLSFQIPIFDNHTKTVYCKCIGWRSVATANQELAEGDHVRCEVGKIERSEWKNNEGITYINPKFTIHALQVDGRNTCADDADPLPQSPVQQQLGTPGGFGDGVNTPDMPPDVPTTDPDPFL